MSYKTGPGTSISVM